MYAYNRHMNKNKLFAWEIKPNFHQYPQCWAHSTTSRNSRGNGIWQCEKKEFDGIIEGGGVGGEAAHNGLKFTMRRNLLNWCDLVSIGKKLRFYVVGVVRIY